MNRRSFLSACCATAVAPFAPSPSAGQQLNSATPTPARPRRAVQVLRSVRAVPAEIVGSFREPISFAQAQSGQYFVFDRGGHAVYGIDAALTAAWKIVQIGGETGRILQPTAFGLSPNGTFVVADRPGASERVQVFTPGGSVLGGFTIPGRAPETITLDGIVLTGTGSLHFDGRRLLLSQPETRALISEYSLSGTPLRTFGALRATGHEADRDVHMGLNSGIPLPTPDGGFLFVFRAGTPVFRKYDSGGRFLFERHIEGPELDPILHAMPTSWERRRDSRQELIPVIPPVVREAAVDNAGSLWLSFVGSDRSYVYSPDGEKARVLRFEGAGPIVPSSLFFSASGRLLVTPGCYEFNPDR